MTYRRRSLLIGGIGAALLCAATPAHAQDNSSAGASLAAPPPTTAPPPPLRDFRLPGRTVVQQAPEQQQPAVPVATPPITTAQPAAQRPPPGPARPAAQRPARPSPTPAQATPAATPATDLPAAPIPIEAAPQPAPAAPSAGRPQDGSGFSWLYLVPVGLLALLAFAFLRHRRKRGEDDAGDVSAIESPAAPAAKPEPLLRPWLELDLKAERASATDAETLVQFVLEITNSGKAPARNLRIDVKMFNAGQEQDKEIGAFYRTAGRESTKCSLPGIAPGTTGAIKGEVAMPRDEMRAVVLDDKYLFIPVIAVNALYDWGDGRTGQTSKSYVVGRELEQPSAKMGAFRVDQGPRIWRTVGQRQHKLARRV
ncbi:MAG TPA: hypothetical protein VEW71_09880 [Allosphingosinicella sp.]|nr:hypothetical protein [Allosphingosinicella sp.]